MNPLGQRALHNSTDPLTERVGLCVPSTLEAFILLVLAWVLSTVLRAALGRTRASSKLIRIGY